MTFSSCTSISVPSRVATAYRGDTEEPVSPVLIPPWISVDTFGLRILEQDSGWYSTDVVANTSLKANTKVTSLCYLIRRTVQN
jgi:hypothetical protein